MKKQTTFLMLVIFLVSMACHVLFPTSTTRDGTVISACTDIVKAVRGVQPGGGPLALLESGIKRGDVFDVNDYFDVLPHISMQEGYSLDYVYQVDSLGAYPILYALRDGQTPYASISDIPENTQLPDYREHLDVEDVEQGYFELTAFQIMAGQFYLDWHANYNDTEIVCNTNDVDAIIADINDGNFGIPFDISQQVKARAMRDIEPLVTLTDDTARVVLIVFTKWGGFYRWTYTISRSFPHTFLDVETENIVPYDCGIMF